jgi:uncharacterized protein (DUF885 family)
VSDSELAPIAAQALESRLARDPVEATYLGDHRRDGELPDPSSDAARARAAELRAELAALDALAPEPDVDATVDAAMLRTALAAELLELDEIGEAEWNPMLYNPGAGIHALVSRDFAPLPERLDAVARRLTAVPEYLAAAREGLGVPSRVHLDTALAQLDGTIGVIDGELPPGHPAIDAAAPRARQAIREHQVWLAARADHAVRDPRLGETLFRAKLALTLDTAFDPLDLLARAEADLAQVSAEMTELAGRMAGTSSPDAGTVRAVLDELAADAPDDATILQLCRDAMSTATSFVRGHDLVTVYDDPVEVVEMPEMDRGVAVAYCRESGPLETAVLPTEYAVSPTPADWTREQVASFYREYNHHMVHNLTVHEAMPGHALQLMHSNRYRAGTPIRMVWASGSFIEGWAVYAEAVMAGQRYLADVSDRAADAVRMQQLKMALRSILNTIMDVSFHCGDLDEAGALDLMMRRGYQEQGEATGKWRRVQLTSTQLCTYYVGSVEVAAVAKDLSAARPDWSQRQLHDAMLAHGSPSPRHLRTLLGLPAA